MATKTAKKKTTTKAAPAKKAAASKKELPVGLYKERYPEAHQATGKYKFFYVLFAFTTVLFACLSVYFFLKASTASPTEMARMYFRGNNPDFEIVRTRIRDRIAWIMNATRPVILTYLLIFLCFALYELGRFLRGASLFCGLIFSLPMLYQLLS